MAALLGTSLLLPIRRAQSAFRGIVLAGWIDKDGAKALTALGRALQGFAEAFEHEAARAVLVDLDALADDLSHASAAAIIHRHVTKIDKALP